MMDRREFFKKLCALSGSMIIPLGCSQEDDTAALDLSTTQTDTTPVFSKQAFIDSIDNVFSVSHQKYGVVDTRLSTVNNELLITESEQFTISLSGPEVPVLEEDTYAIYNDNFGDIALHLQPGEASEGRQNYLAVFNLMYA